MRLLQSIHDQIYVMREYGGKPSEVHVGPDMAMHLGREARQLFKSVAYSSDGHLDSVYGLKVIVDPDAPAGVIYVK